MSETSVQKPEKFLENCELFEDKVRKLLTELHILRNDKKPWQKSGLDNQIEIGELKQQIQHLTRENSEQKQKLDVVLDVVRRMENNCGGSDKELSTFNLDAVTRERDVFKKELQKSEMAKLQLTRSNSQQLDTIKYLKDTLQATIDEKSKIRHEIDAIQKDMLSASTNFKAIQSAYGKISKIVNHSVATVNFYKSSYDEILIKLQQATKQLVIYQAQHNENNSSSDNQQQFADEIKYHAEIQMKYNQLLKDHNEYKQEINDFMKNSLSISAKIILQLTTELNELKKNAKEESTTKITDQPPPSIDLEP